MAARDNIRPRVEIEIGDTPFGAAALEFVTSVRVDLALDKEDLITLRVQNPILDTPGQPRTSRLVFTDSLAFMPGNLLKVYLGFGASVGDNPVAAGLVRRYLPVFPAEGMPSLTISALGAGCLMMDGSPTVNAMQARAFDEGLELDTIAASVVEEYGFSSRLMQYTTTRPAVPTTKKAGMSDYAFVKALANMLGFEFFTRFNFDSKEWEVVWGEPVPDPSAKKSFTWGPDARENGTPLLLSFEPEFAIQGAPTDVEVFYFDRDTRTWESIPYPPEAADRASETPEFAWQGDDTTVEEELAQVSDSSTGRGLRIRADGIAVEVLPTQNFGSAEEALAWAEGWWRARQYQLITGRGRIYGDHTIRPGQIHELLGLGGGLSGDWYFTEVSHIYDQGSGYYIDFLCRKVLR